MNSDKKEIETVASPIDTPTTPAAPETLQGRSLFAMDMTAAGLVVRTVFLTEQNKLIEMPAIFPDVHYALAQIEELRRMVMERFAQAAHIGAQVIAAQAAEQNKAAAAAAATTEASL
jgi:hypothetical protein